MGIINWFKKKDKDIEELEEGLVRLELLQKKRKLLDVILRKEPTLLTGRTGK